jgi:putative peptide zinc metalloprotease protein
MPAVLLVPQDASRPALVVLRSADGGAPKILSIPSRSGAAPGENPWPFPFPRPGEASAPDHARALSINTGDGTAVYDVAYSTVWVTGQDVHARNDAIALADCTRCTSVAVAFQAVFVIGQSNVIAPVNTSQALNYHCVQCRTTAIAVQLVVSLTEMPDAATKARLDTVLKQLDQLTADLPHLSDSEIWARLKGLEADILQTLAAAGPQLATAADAAAAPVGAPSAAPSGAAPSPGAVAATPSPAASTGESGTRSDSGSSTGSGSGTASGSSGSSGSAGTDVAPSAAPSTAPSAAADGSGTGAAPAPSAEPSTSTTG